jgi:hypothetical protein
MRTRAAVKCALALALSVTTLSPNVAEDSLPDQFVSDDVPAAVTQDVAPAPVAPDIESLAIDGVDDEALEVLDEQPVSQELPELAAESEAPAVLTGELDVDQFTLAGVTWNVTADTGEVAVQVRIRENGQWSAWHPLDTETAAGDLATAEGSEAARIDGTEPLLTDGADGVQVRVDTEEGVGPEDLRLSLINGGESSIDFDLQATPADAGDPGADGVGEGATAGPIVENANLQFPPGKLADDGPYDASRAQSAFESGDRGGLGALPVGVVGNAPKVIRRAQWGADESLRNGEQTLNKTVRAIVVHHTATTNNYTSVNAAQQLRSVYAYHTKSLKWSDIGYNFVVDKFGRVYEGRAGSLLHAVMGAHAGGFNVDTMGVSALGNYQEAAAPADMVASIGHISGWMLGLFDASPTGTVTLTSSGGGTAKYPAGTSVRLNAISGHRDVGNTACPGINLYGQLETVRKVASRFAIDSPPSIPEVGGDGAVPVTADVDGDGITDLGWYKDGKWAFQIANGSVRYISYGGRPGDVPITGDWNAKGRDGIGIFRDGRWYVRESIDAKAPERSFDYGRPGDRPLVGRWAGSTRDGIAVVRGNRWHLRTSPTSGVADRSFSFGRAADVPVAASWLNDGVARPGVVRDKQWHLATSIQRPVTVWSFSMGREGDRPVVGDWNGNRVENAGLVRGTTFFLRNYHSGTGTITSRQFTG